MTSGFEGRWGEHRSASTMSMSHSRASLFWVSSEALEKLPIDEFFEFNPFGRRYRLASGERRYEIEAFDESILFSNDSKLPAAMVWQLARIVPVEV
jgi:hypothetical protein